MKLSAMSVKYLKKLWVTIRRICTDEYKLVLTKTPTIKEYTVFGKKYRYARHYALYRSRWYNNKTCTIVDRPKSSKKPRFSFKCC